MHVFIQYKLQELLADELMYLTSHMPFQFYQRKIMTNCLIDHNLSFQGKDAIFGTVEEK